jgi:hypothetical protein
MSRQHYQALDLYLDWLLPHDEIVWEYFGISVQTFQLVVDLAFPDLGSDGLGHLVGSEYWFPPLLNSALVDVSVDESVDVFADAFVLEHDSKVLSEPGVDLVDGLAHLSVSAMGVARVCMVGSGLGHAKRVRVRQHSLVVLYSLKGYVA